MPFLNSNCVSSCHLTNERQSAAIRLGNAGPDNINNHVALQQFRFKMHHVCGVVRLHGRIPLQFCAFKFV